MNFTFLRYSRTHVIRILRGPRNLFELHDYSNYRSSDYMSSTVVVFPGKKFEFFLPLFNRTAG